MGGIGGGALRFPWTKLPGIFKATVPFGWDFVWICFFFADLRRNRRETIPWFRVMSYLPTLCDAKLTCQHILPKPFEVHNGTSIRFDVIDEAPILKHTRILHGSCLPTHDLNKSQNHREKLPPTNRWETSANLRQLLFLHYDVPTGWSKAKSLRDPTAKLPQRFDILQKKTNNISRAAK